MSTCEYGCFCTPDSIQQLSPKWPSHLQLSIILASLALLILVYGLCLILSVHNVYKYLIKDKRWRIYLMSCFYLIVICLLATRIVSLVYFIRFFDLSNGCQIYWANELDTAATYLKALLGL